MEFYDINVKDAKGNIVQMSEYAGKVLQPSKHTAAPVSKPEPASDDLKVRLEKIEMGDLVHHKKFGKGEVVKINKNEKFI